MHFGERDLAGNLGILPSQWGLLDMVCKLLKPGPVALHVAPNSCKLVADYLIRNQRLAKRVAPVRIVKRLGQAGTSLAVAANGHYESLLIEVCHNDSKTFVLLAKDVLNRDMDIVQFDEAGTTAILPAVWYASPCEALRGDRDDENRYTTHARTTRPHGRCHVCCSWHAGDPFLVAIHHVVLAVRCLRRGRL